jgi:hypothetical protein
MVVDGSQPVGVTIDEGVKLAKIFAADSAPGFINGVLGAIAKSPQRLSADEAGNGHAPADARPPADAEAGDEA